MTLSAVGATDMQQLQAGYAQDIAQTLGIEVDAVMDAEGHPGGVTPTLADRSASTCTTRATTTGLLHRHGIAPDASVTRPVPETAQGGLPTPLYLPAKLVPTR